MKTLAKHFCNNLFITPTNVGEIMWFTLFVLLLMGYMGPCFTAVAGISQSMSPLDCTDPGWVMVVCELFSPRHQLPRITALRVTPVTHVDSKLSMWAKHWINVVSEIGNKGKSFQILFFLWFSDILIPNMKRTFVIKMSFIVKDHNDQVKAEGIFTDSPFMLI